MRILRIVDEGETLWMRYDLLQGLMDDGIPGIRVDLASRVSAPVGDVNFEESMRMFAPSSEFPRVEDIAQSISEIDDIIYRINRRNDFPSSDAIMLHEKSDGENYERRAAIFSASLQPTSEGSVGALMIGSGWTGLLVLERGAWEVLETRAIAQKDLELDPTLPESTAVLYVEGTGGTIDNRIKALTLDMSNVFARTIAVGIRRYTQYYHPILNLGETPVPDGSPYRQIDYAAGSRWTWPPNPPSETNQPPQWVGLAHKVYETPNAESIMTLNEATGHAIDTRLDDFIGNYEVFLRVGFPQITGGVYPEAYYKFRLGYGDTDNLISYNEPVYINRNAILPYDTLRPEEWNLISLGTLSIPVGMFVAGLGGGYLKSFAFSLSSELIGDALPLEEIFLDSLILMPRNTITFQPVGYFLESMQQTLVYGQDPFLDSGLVVSEALATYTMTRDLILPSLDQIHMVVMKNVRPSFDAPQTMTMDMTYYERYANTTSQ